MTSNHKILNESVLEMLVSIDSVVQTLDIDFYLVGAVARDCHLSKLPGWQPNRRTLDVDLAVTIASEEQFIQLKTALIKSGLFTEHPTEPIKLFYKNEIELDLLPFGEIETNGVTVLTKPRIFTLDMPGFELLSKHTSLIAFDPFLKLQVCPIEGIIMLKLIAWSDRPQRSKDLIDIQHIISHYFELSSENIYDEHFDVMELYPTSDNNYIQKVSAHVIGRKIAGYLINTPTLKQRIISILMSKDENFWTNILNGLMK